jgi:hypothetical protein
MSAWTVESRDRLWLVGVSGYDSVQVAAPTMGKARYRAFLMFRDAFGRGHTFYSFLARGVRVTLQEQSS